MKDIKKAIQLEQEYVKAKLQKQNSYNLINKLNQCGFDTFKEFQSAKKQYLFNNTHFNFIESSLNNYIDDALTIFNQQSPTVAFLNINAPFIFTGQDDYNKQYCIDNNIYIIPHFGKGGTIVGDKGDLAFGICCKTYINISMIDILIKLKNILQKYTSAKITIDHNDIMINNKKVIGITTYTQGNFSFYVIYCSFSDKTDLINNICIKKRKEPGYISFISSDILKEEVESWLRKNVI